MQLGLTILVLRLLFLQVPNEVPLFGKKKASLRFLLRNPMTLFSDNNREGNMCLDKLPSMGQHFLGYFLLETLSSGIRKDFLRIVEGSLTFVVVSFFSFFSFSFFCFFSFYFLGNEFGPPPLLLKVIRFANT